MSAAAKRMCIGVSCSNTASTLQCPTCLKLGQESFFCGQECFKNSWVALLKPQTSTRALTHSVPRRLPAFRITLLQSEHKILHKKTPSSTSLIQSLHDLHLPAPLPYDAVTGTHDPFPNFPYTGELRATYPLSATRTLPASIKRPDYAADGIPRSEYLHGRSNKNITILNARECEAMRKVCRLAREVLDIAAAASKPGVTTDQIDEIVHKACIERDSYPSPLNYNKFPKSLCTSINEVICHGIPDARPLVDGDILNIDVTLYHGGFHGDLNETYYIGDKALADPDTVRVVEASRVCLEEAIKLVKPGMPFKAPGNLIEKLAKERGCGVVKTYCGHGINKLFHCAPNVPHYSKSKAVGVAKPGMCFTIEPMVTLGSYKDKTWPDNWTAATSDGLKTAQFEHTLLVTADGVEVLTARREDSPGGPVPMPEKKGEGESAVL